MHKTTSFFPSSRYLVLTSSGANRQVREG
jgi:hypothetical protein